ncbi:MAG: hypothetical protein ABI867_44865 [Kofleriaceae bacterium]
MSEAMLVCVVILAGAGASYLAMLVRPGKRELRCLPPCSAVPVLRDGKRSLYQCPACERELVRDGEHLMDLAEWQASVTPTLPKATVIRE